MSFIRIWEESILDHWAKCEKKCREKCKDDESCFNECFSKCEESFLEEVV